MLFVQPSGQDGEQIVGELRVIPVHQLRPNPIALREIKVSDQLLGLIWSIRARGLYGVITVRPVDDYYQIVDGLVRYWACRAAQLKEIPCDIVNFTDDEVLEFEIIKSVHRIETTPEEYSKALINICKRDPNLTFPALMNRLDKTSKLLEEMLLPVLGQLSWSELDDVKAGNRPIL